MNARPPRRRMLISYAVLYMIFVATAARAIFSLQDQADFWVMVGLLAFYLLLLVFEPLLVARNLAYLHALNALQTLIGLFLLLTVGEFDYFALLFIPPCAQSILNFPRKLAFAWIGVIVLWMEIALFSHFPLEESVGYLIVYPAAIMLLTGFSYLAREAEEAQSHSEALLADLQEANRKLKAYAEQVQELAAAEERNRLARELHDSVTQIIFGLTLTAQAARILLDRDPSRVPAQLDHMQELAQSALTEMRGLIQQLHPHAIADEGLAGALRRLAAERHANDGLTVNLQIRGERRLPANVEEGLLRFTQEALNNIIKHARVDHAAVTLNLEDENQVLIEVQDSGAGFDPARARSLPGHLGLTSMSERIETLGGTLIIQSSPGKGTRLCVALSLAQEVEHA